MKKIIIAISFILAAQICQGSGQPVVKIDDEIPVATKKAVDDLNGIALKAIKENRPEILIALFVDEAKSDGALRSSIKETCAKLSGITKSTEFYTYRDYLIDARGCGSSALKLPADDKNNFLITLQEERGPVLISLLTSKAGLKDYSFCFVYIDEGKGWRINKFHSGLFKIASKSPLEWYEEAKGMYDKGWVVPAIQRMQVAESFMRPAPFIEYDREKEAGIFFKEIQARSAKEYKFPMVASWVQDKPRIYGLDFQFVGGSLEPVVVYVTKIPLNKGPYIQEEVNWISLKLDTLIPGITRTTSEVIYKAFTEPPLKQDKQYKFRTVPSRVR